MRRCSLVQKRRGSTNLTPSIQLERPPQTDDELYWLVRAMFGVAIPRTRVCPEHTPPFVAFADAYFNRNSLNPESSNTSMGLWHGSRGLSGKSYALSVLGLVKALMLGNEVNLLGGSLAQSTNIHKHMRASTGYPSFPQYMVLEETNTKVLLANKGAIYPLTASQKTVRGPHPPFLLLDEIDEMDQDILDAALGQPMRQKNYLGEWVRPYTVMCSTWQNPQGTFTEMQKRAIENDWPIYQWCYRESANPVDGWLTEEAIEEKKRVISKEMWRVEYELGEPSIGNRAFDSEAVKRAFSLPFEPMEQKESKDFEEYRFENWRSDGTYVIAADWAKEQDYTVIAVGRVDCEPHRVVYYAKFNRLPYPIMIDYFNREMRRYDAYGIHDATGLGNVIQDHLDFRARPFYMVGDKRARMLSEHVGSIESDKWRFPMIKSAYLAHLWCQVGDLYKGHTQEFHLPDEVCCFALLEYQARRFAPNVGPIVEKRGPENENRYSKVFEPPRVEGEVRVEEQPRYLLG